MSARGITSGFAAALAASSVAPFYLVQINFTGGTQYLCGLAHAVSYGGNTYTPTLGVMQIEPIRETAGSYEGLQITIGGVNATQIGLALSEPFKGRAITVRMACIDAAGAMQVDAEAWSGVLDGPVHTIGADGTGTIAIKAEHVLALWDRPIIRRWTDAQQQAEFAGDTGLRYVADLANRRIFWLLAAYFKV